MATRFIKECMNDYAVELTVEEKRDFLERFYTWDTDSKKYLYKDNFDACLREFVVEMFEISEIQNYTLRQYLVEECCNGGWFDLKMFLSDISDDDEVDRSADEEDDDTMSD
jgi:hypothetical protein